MLTQEEKHALIRILGGKFADILYECEKEPQIYLSYHTVKGKDYPALVVICGEKRKKVHINQAEWEQFVTEKYNIRLQKALKEINNLKKNPKKLTEVEMQRAKKAVKELQKASKKLSTKNAEEVLKVLQELKELTENRSIWEYLFAQRKKLDNQIFPHWVWRDRKTEVEIWDIPALRELRLHITQKDPVRGRVKRHEVIPYLCKDQNSYILSVDPPRILKISAEGIEINGKPIVKKDENTKKLVVNLEGL